MDRLHQIAQLLVSSWALSGDEEHNKIPTSHGLLDQAIKALWDKKDLPEWAAQELHFANSRIGLQCVELPAILDWAQLADLTSVPNPWYQVTQVQVTRPTARRLLKKLPVNEQEVAELGKKLRSEIERLKSGFSNPIEVAM